MEEGQTEKKSPVLKIIGCGCLSLALIGVIIGGVIAMGVGKALKSGAPYIDSLAAVQGNPAAIQALGEPIKPGFMPTGNISVENDTGEVNYSIGVSGPKGKGKITVIGTKAGGVWSYQTWHLKVDGQEDVISLGK